MNIPWEMLFELITKLVEQCLAQGRPEGDIRSSLISPTGADWWSVWRGMGRMGIRGKERREYMKALREQRDKVTGDLADEIISEAKAEQ